MKTREICGCGKILKEDEGFTLDNGRVIQRPISCYDCLINHACCLRFAPEHAIDTLRRWGYVISHPDPLKDKKLARENTVVEDVKSTTFCEN